LRQGKIFDVELATDDPREAERELTAMAKQLLANPVIETFEVYVRPKA
jgi:phosphoribosylformylglycinamidine synthase